MNQRIQREGERGGGGTERAGEPKATERERERERERELVNQRLHRERQRERERAGEPRQEAERLCLWSRETDAPASAPWLMTIYGEGVG